MIMSSYKGMLNCPLIVPFKCPLVAEFFVAHTCASYWHHNIRLSKRFHNIVYTGWTKAYKETAEEFSVDSHLGCFLEGNIIFSWYNLHHNIDISSMLLGYNEYWRYECMPCSSTFWYALEKMGPMVSNCLLVATMLSFASFGRTLDLGYKLF